MSTLDIFLCDSFAVLNQRPRIWDSACMILIGKN